MAERYRERLLETEEEKKEREHREAQEVKAEEERRRQQHVRRPSRRRLSQPRKPRIVRVEITWDNGKVMFLEGEEATQWVKTADASFIYAQGHGLSFPSSYWRTKPTSTPDS